MKIPKVIHYCWFGRGEKNELIQKCIASWHKYAPDWEIIEWNEDNFDVTFCPYAEKAYREKRYGFLTDAARLKIIYENGGVYLDTDAELVNALDDLLVNGAWFSYGTDTEINTGSGFGAKKGHPFIRKLLDHYTSLSRSDKFIVCTERDTEIFRAEFPEFFGNKWLRQDQRLGEDILILWDIWKYTNHHYTGTWQTPLQKFVNKTKILKSIYHWGKQLIKQ